MTATKKDPNQNYGYYEVDRMAKRTDQTLRLTTAEEILITHALGVYAKEPTFTYNKDLIPDMKALREKWNAICANAK
jgi:hypothetical protein